MCPVTIVSFGYQDRAFVFDLVLDPHMNQRFRGCGLGVERGIEARPQRQTGRDLDLPRGRRGDGGKHVRGFEGNDRS